MDRQQVIAMLSDLGVESETEAEVTFGEDAQPSVLACAQGAMFTVESVHKVLFRQGYLKLETGKGETVLLPDSTVVGFKRKKQAAQKGTGFHMD